MKKTLLLLSVLYAAFSMFSFSGGFGSPATGAPGENGTTCGQGGCHSAGQFDVELNLSMIDSNGESVEEFIAGETYTVALKVDHTGLPSGYGFQMVCLTEDGDQPINNFSDLPDNVKETMRMNRQYVEHSSRLPVDSIPITWTAPAAETGSVTFYASGNAVNGNGTSSGDGANVGSFTFMELMDSSSEEISAPTIDIFPNPTTDYIYTETDKQISEMTVLDMQGKIMTRTTKDKVDVSALANGQYILKIQTIDGQQHSKKIQKN